jgi:ketosteroid isomerase-like protein
VRETNAELVRRALDAANQEPPDVATLMEVYALDHLLITDWGTGDTESYRGLEGFQKAMADNSEQWNDFSVEPEQIIDADGDRVVVVARSRGRGTSSGAAVDRQTGIVLTVRDGQIVTTRFYPDPPDAFAAAGLDPP